MPEPEPGATRRPDLVDRLRLLLVGQPGLREVAMFGGRSFMVGGRLVVAARPGGDLLVRVDEAHVDALMRAPGAARAEMGPGRLMGRAWISVAASALADDAQLASWVETALGHGGVDRRHDPA